MNRRACHEYDILEVFEAGIELKGAEGQSRLRAGAGQSARRLRPNRRWRSVVSRSTDRALPEYASGFGAVDADRARKLLLHRHQIDELQDQVAEQSLTLVPLSIYFSEGRAKVEIVLGSWAAPI